MASLCKRQQCTVERRGFRQELDSWRHKLIHCVGFESILEGLFGQELVEDLKLFKACEPEAVSDWSFDENCLFCCLRRDKVKEHLVGLSNQGCEDPAKAVLLNDQTKINRLEQQAEEFLSAVLYRKDVPSFSDPHIPVVAREIMQRMIRQFAAEYTSKTSSTQDRPTDPQPCTVQSLPRPPSFSGATPSTSPGAPASAHNPVLSKLLMADQEVPLDLTIKKPKAEPTEQEGVLDLSLRKNRYTSSSLSVHSPYLSPNTSTVKGESPEIYISKAKELQSTSTLEQFMAKLCPHHQRQIVDALGFLQTEVKALARCSSLQAPCHTPDNQESTTSITTSSPVTYEKSVSEPSPSAVSTQSTQGMSLVIASSPTTTKEVPEESGLLKSSLTADPCLDLHTLGLGSAMALVNSTLNPSDPENNRHSDHVPLKMKIMKTNKLADGKKLSCVLTTSLITQSDTMEEKQGKSDSSNKTESQSARLSSTVKRHSHMNQDGQTKDIAAKPFPVHKTSNTLLADVPRTARKTIRGSSDHRTRNSASRVIIDPDLGNCDIVYINKPITECLREQQCHMPPRRNARKSTRGHMYVEEMWELKTVRTLAGRNQSSNCPNPMPELFTLVTPKQVLAKPDGVPPIDMPFIRGCGQTVQQTPSEESNDREMPGTGDEVEALANQFDLIVETSQTDQSKNNEQATCESTSKAPEENGEKAANEVQDATSNAIQTGESDQLDESVVETSPAVEETREIDQDLNEFTEQEVDLMERPEDDVMKEAELIPVTESGESEQQQKDTLPTVAITVQEEVNEKVENTKCEQTLEPQLVEPKLSDKLGTEENSLTAPAESIVKEQEMDIAPVTSVVNNAAPEDDDEYDVSAKSLESLLKELPPWRRKRGTVVSLPKRLREKQSVIVGYVNGRPVSASDRSLRRRSSNSIPTTPKKAAEKPTHSGPENVPSPQNIPETDGAITSENIPMIPQETEHVPEIPQTPETKRLPKSSTKLSKKKSAAIVQHNQQETQVEFIHVSDESIDIPQHTPSKRPLRSARQQLPGTTESPVCPNAIVSSSPTPTSDHSIPSMDAVQLLATSPSPPPSVLLPLSLESPVSPIAPEQSQQCTHEHAVELNVADGQSAKTRPKEIQKQEMESRLQTKQKLRSAKVAMVDDKNEKEKCCSTLESQIVQSNETPSSTLTSERSLGEVETCEMAVKTSNVCLLHDEPSLGSTISSVLGKPARMPLRSESSKAETSSQLLGPQPAENMKLALRSQRLATPSTSTIDIGRKKKQIVSPIRRKPEIMGRTSSSGMLPPSSDTPFVLAPHEPRKQTVHKLIETLNGEANQHLITNLNIKFDRMQKGWIQMDKEGQSATKYRNKADRQAAIWKSKRRARKPKSVEQHKYSPVQMLFMKNFNLTSICRWFLESTETKSLVIVKKVNTRLPSETQLCFHSSSGVSGTSQGVFPSIQAERLKKHLKKFAIASPVKNNPKSQKLIAKVLEQEAVKEKDKELTDANQALTKPSSVPVSVQISEGHKVSGKSKNPASARILRKYSNIREKRQVQQTNAGHKETTKTLKHSKLKKLTTSKSVSKSNPKSTLKTQKAAIPVDDQAKVLSPTASKGKPNTGRKPSEKPAVSERTVKSSGSNKASRELVRKASVSPQRCSQRLGSPKTLKKLIQSTKSKVHSNKNPLEMAKIEVENLAKASSTKSQTKESLQNKVSESDAVETTVGATQQNMDTKSPISSDQVLTRSQKKMEAMLPVNASPTTASKKALKSNTSGLSLSGSKKAGGEAVVTRSGTPKSSRKKGLVPSPSRSVTKKKPTKRAQEYLETPIKRTRMSQIK